MLATSLPSGTMKAGLQKGDIQVNTSGCHVLIYMDYMDLPSTFCEVTKNNNNSLWYFESLLDNNN